MAPLADAPTVDPRWDTRAGRPPSGPPAWQRIPQLPPGYRWIAVRPGAAPPRLRGRRLWRPTPRYAAVPRWSLYDRLEQPAADVERPAGKAPSVATIRAVLFMSVLALCMTALVYVVRYVLLVINRNTLLNSLVAIAADWLGMLASVVAIAAVIASGVLLIRWLIARRAAVFSHHGLPEPRSVRALWAGCAVPLANLLWAPVYVIELAILEDHYRRIRRTIAEWWVAWFSSYVVAVFAIVTSFATDAQGIANNTVLMVFAYLLAATALAAAGRVFEGFERKPVTRPAHRWVVVAPGDQPGPGAARPGGPVELQGQEPAA